MSAVFYKGYEKSEASDKRWLNWQELQFYTLLTRMLISKLFQGYLFLPIILPLEIQKCYISSVRGFPTTGVFDKWTNNLYIVKKLNVNFHSFAVTVYLATIQIWEHLPNISLGTVDTLLRAVPLARVCDCLYTSLIWLSSITELWEINRSRLNKEKILLNTLAFGREWTRGQYLYKGTVPLKWQVSTS